MTEVDEEMFGILLQHHTLAYAKKKDLDKRAKRSRLRKEYSQMLKARNKGSAWLLRNVIKHPIDPSWETGTYCACHPEARKQIAKQLEEGKTCWVLDIVNLKKEKNRYVIRSAFKVHRVESKCRRGKEGPDLRFCNYYFVKLVPIPLPNRFQRGKLWSHPRTRKNGKQISDTLTRSLCKKMRIQYEQLSSCQRPSVIGHQDWRSIVAIARRSKSLC